MPVTFESDELFAINTMLSVVGESPVNSVSSQTPSVAIAKNVLDECNRALQGRGWWWNTELDHEITKASNNQFPVPRSWIRIVDRNNNQAAKRLTIRGDEDDNGNRYVYDTRNRTFVLQLDKVKVDAVVFLDFATELPEAAKRYISLRAARLFHHRILGSARKHTFNQEDELVAWADLLRDEVEQAEYSMISGGPGAQIVNRGRLRDRRGEEPGPIGVPL